MGGENFVESPAGLVQLVATPSRIQEGRLTVLVELKTQKDESVKRPPYDLALVLDKSGSMSGAKLHGAKKAICHCVESMGAGDRLHLICYDSNVETTFAHATMRDEAEKKKLIQKVQTIQAGSCTNMGLGLERTLQIFDSSPEGAEQVEKGRGKRVFLFSDGLVNEGAKGSELLRMVANLLANGIQTSSFGIGKDFSEDLMKLIAEHGNGDYSFLDREDHIHKYVDKSLRCVLGTLGLGARLTGRGRNGANVKSILGHDDMVRGADIGDVREDNIKQILFEVEIAEFDVENPPSIDFELTYKSTRDPVSPYVSIPITLVLPAKKETEETEQTTRVDIALAVFRTSELDEKVIELLDQGRIQDAIQIKSKNLEMLSAYSERDTTGFCSAVVHRGTKTLSKMKSGESVKQMRKWVDYEAQMERALSACSIGYNSDSDGGSDDGERFDAAAVHAGVPTSSARKLSFGASIKDKVTSLFRKSSPSHNSPVARKRSNTNRSGSDTDDSDSESDLGSVSDADSLPTTPRAFTNPPPTAPLADSSILRMAS